MSVLEEALKAEKNKLEEQERCLRRYLAETQGRLQDAKSRLWLVYGLLGQNKIEVN